MGAGISIRCLHKVSNDGWYWEENYTDPNGDDVHHTCFTDGDGCGVAYWREDWSKGYESYDEVQLVAPTEFSLPKDRRRAYRKIRYRLERLAAGKTVEVEAPWFDEPAQRKSDALPLTHWPHNISVPDITAPSLEYISVQESVRRGRVARGVV